MNENGIVKLIVALFALFIIIGVGTMVLPCFN